MHPDWKWMTAASYVICFVCMLGIIGKTNPPSSSIVGFGHGFIRAPSALGNLGFAMAIPFLAMIPTAIVAYPFRFLYRIKQRPDRKTFTNFKMLVFAAIVAIINASLYSGD